MFKFKIIKKILFFFSVSFSFIFSANQTILSEFDYLAKMVSKDIQIAVYDGIIPADIAVTSFAVYGFEADERQYLEEVMNRIFYSDISFKLITIPESKLIIAEEQDDKIIIKKGASKNSDLKEYAESINSKHYGEIYAFLFKEKIFLKILVHDADSGDVVWSKEWSVKRADSFVWEIGYLAGLENITTSPILQNYLHLFFGSRVVGLGDFGVSINNGVSILFTEGASFANFSADNIGEMYYNLLLAPKVSLNLFELIKMSYFGLDLFIIIEPGLKMSMFVLDKAQESGKELFSPDFFFSANLGLVFGINHNINIQVSFDAMLQTLMMGAYWKFK